tara:strand:+ start:1305 stop:1784 length:480 start_codon:yes stop_codon:yes gene_type:complete
MNRNRIYEQLKIDEGVIYEVYTDHLGYPTFGVGHLILEGDAEFRAENGTPVSEERVKECFEKDLDIAIDECKALFKEFWEGYPPDLQEVLVNMMFNLGRPRLGKFKKFIKAINEANWSEAAIEMMDSRWATQVGPRATRLRDRVRVLPDFRVKIPGKNA